MSTQLHGRDGRQENRANLPTNNLEISTGHVSKYTFGHRVAEIQASRGNREGNQAFVADTENNGYYDAEQYSDVLLRYADFSTYKV